MYLNDENIEIKPNNCIRENKEKNENKWIQPEQDWFNE